MSLSVAAYERKYLRELWIRRAKGIRCRPDEGPRRSLPSVYNMKGRSKFGKAKTGALHRWSFIVSNACPSSPWETRLGADAQIWISSKRLPRIHECPNKNRYPWNSIVALDTRSFHPKTKAPMSEIAAELKIPTCSVIR